VSGISAGQREPSPSSAVMIGAGNIGRGFIGAAFAASGYRTIFIDINKALVDEINARGEYTVELLSPGGGSVETCVRGICAVDGNDIESAAAAIAGADICATAVGMRNLSFVASMLAPALKTRARNKMPPLDIIVCENMMDAGRSLRGFVQAKLPEELRGTVDEGTGYPEAVIGRMVPIQTEEMRKGDPLRMCVEDYSFIPVDKSAFKGEIPGIEGLTPLDGFEYYVKRKLFIHNLGHAAIGYLGLLGGYAYISDAAEDPDILFLAAGAMHESAAALSLENSADAANLNRNIDSLLYRFSNKALKDTCERVSADPARKLGKQDRITGALENCERFGLPVVYIAAVAAAASFVYGSNCNDDKKAPLPQLASVMGISEDSKTYIMIEILREAVLSQGYGSRYALEVLRREVVKMAGDIKVL